VGARLASEVAFFHIRKDSGEKRGPAVFGLLRRRRRGRLLHLGFFAAQKLTFEIVAQLYLNTRKCNNKHPQLM
jgi:hypothetical protein